MKQRTPWQRLALSIFGIVIITGKWWAAITMLTAVKVEHVAAYTTMTTNSDYVTGAIVIFMVSGKLVYDWSMRTGSTIAETGEQKIERVIAPKHFDPLGRPQANNDL